MQLASTKGGESLDNFAKVAGVSSSEFKKAFEEDASNALLMFIDGLANAEDKGQSAIGMLDAMGISEVRLRDAILRASGANELFRDSLQLGNKAWDENTALVNEAQERYKTLESQLKIAKNRIIDVAIELGGTLAPTLKIVADGVAKVTEWFGKIPKSIQVAVIAGGLLIAGFGLIVTVIGSLITSITAVGGGLVSLAGVLGLTGGATVTATGAIGLLGTAFVSMLTTIAPWIAGITAVVGVLYKVHKTMKEDAIPEIDRFGDSVSESTKKAVGGFLDLEEKATMSLNKLQWSGGKLTKSTADEIVSNFSEMSKQVVNKFEEQKSNSIEVLNKMFSESDVISEKEQKRMIENTQRKYDASIKITKESNDRIKEITDLALKEERELTVRERHEIYTIKANMRDTAVRIMSESEKEQLAIMERLRVQSTEISARQSAEIVQQSKKQKDGAIKEAEEEYNERLKVAGELRSDGTIVSADMATRIVAEAERQKKESITKAEEMHNGIVDEAKKQSKEHIDEVDWETGEILTKWDIFNTDVQATVGKADKWMTDNVTGLVEWTKKKWAENQSATKGSWELTSADASRIWGNIKDTLGLNSDDMVKKQKENNEKQKTQSKSNMGEMYRDTTKWLSDKAKALSDWSTKQDVTTANNNQREKSVASVHWHEMLGTIGNKAKDIYNSVAKWFGDSVTNTRNAWTSAKADASRIWGDIKSSIANKAKEIYDDTVRKVNNTKKSVSDAWNNTKSETSRLWEGIKTTVRNKINDIVADAKALPGKMADGIRNGAEKMKSAMLSVWNGAKNIMRIPVNGIVKGANWVLGKLGVSKDKQIPSMPHYAKGTPKGGHPGGMALVNDQKGSTYREAIKSPNGEVFVPEGRNILIPNMPKGTQVLPAKETKDMYRYAKGTSRFDLGHGTFAKAKDIGSKITKKVANVVTDKIDDIFSFISKPVELAKKVISNNVSYGNATGMALDMGKGLVGKATTQMGDWIKSKFSALAPTNGGGAGGTFSGAGSAPMFSGGRGFAGLVRTSPYGMRRHPISGKAKMHTGVDFGGGQRYGHPIYAQAPGTVDFAGKMGGYGNVLRTRVGNLQHMYAHLQSIVARMGQSVVPGQLVGKMGSTGNSTGPHVHYEVRRNGQHIHPGYAKGTNSAQGGISTVGEQGREILLYPDGSMEMANNGTEYKNLPTGTQVLNNKETKDVLSGKTSHKINAYQSSNNELKDLAITKVNEDIDIKSDEYKMMLLEHVKDNVSKIENHSNQINMLLRNNSISSIFTPNISSGIESRSELKGLSKTIDFNTNNKEIPQSQDVNIYIDKAVIREDADLDKLAKKIKREQDIQERAGGRVTYGN